MFIQVPLKPGNINVSIMISSRSNPKIKNIIKLQKGSERRKQGLVLIEGKREIERALQAGWIVETLFVCHELSENTFQQIEHQLNANCSIEEVSKEVFEHIAYREGSDGLLAISNPHSLHLSELKLPSNPLIVVLEAVEKPGNLGAILRTTDAAGVDAVIICDPLTDLYNPNTIRSSLGCIFSQQVVASDSKQVIEYLKEKKISIFCTALTASTDYLQINYQKPSAIVMGTESTGLSDHWLKASDQNILIEMRGIADSLNVSVSAAIVVFEAIRQRKAGI
ncbi:MAG: rRNA methylase [Bacteroidetes bacterium]|nr:MAG: rRNA methylase [Bacteroidota bacterium]